MRGLFLVILCFLVFFSGAQIPEERLSDWSKAGSHLHEVERQLVSFAEMGGSADGSTNNDAVWNVLLADYSDTPIEIQFDAGVYYFSQTLNIPSFWKLQGSSEGTSKLLFDLNGFGHCVLIRGVRTSVPDTLSDQLHRGDNVLKGFFPNVAADDWLLLSPKNDAGITSSWAIGTTGQIVTVANMDASAISLVTPLRRTYLVGEHLRLKKITPVQAVEINHLIIERLDKTTTQTANIWIENAVNCKISCVESINCNFAHIALQYASNITIEGGYYHHGFDYGGGGKAYGVVAQMASGDNLIQDNIFEHLRHSMLLQAGANGNVFLGNYSFDPFWKEGFLPSNSAGDMVLHGNYPYVNLFEGNVVQNWVIDDSHGINGPHNVFFRNRAENYGLVMNNNPPTDSVVMVGNEITNTGFLKGNWMIAGKGHFLYGNNVKGSCIPVNTEEGIATTIFPELENEAAHAVGFPNALNAFQIETQQRYAEGEKVSCSSITTAFEEFEETGQASIQVVGNRIISSKSSITQVRIYNVMGQEVTRVLMSKDNTVKLPISLKGMLFICWEDEGISFVIRAVVR